MLDLIKMQREYFKELSKEIKEDLNLKRVEVLNFTEKHDLNTRYSNEVHTKLVYNMSLIDNSDTLFALEITREIDFANYDEEQYKIDLHDSIKNILEAKEKKIIGIIIDNIRVITIED